MNSLEPFDRLNFNDQRVFDDKVESITAIQPLTLVDDWQRSLSFDTQSATYQLEGKTRLVGVFQQTRPEFAMNFKRSTDYRFCQRIQFLSHALAECKDRDS